MDIVTTITALALGGTENNPLIAHLMAWGPVSGLILSKLMVTVVALTAAFLRKDRGLRVANFAFSGIVAWNVSVIARLAMAL